MNHPFCSALTDHDPDPYVANIPQITLQNSNFRTAVWTGCYFQMTLMCIPPCDEIGLEIHPETDQLIRIEQGKATVQMGQCKNHMDFQKSMHTGDAVLVPAGTWHNVLNTGRTPLKVSVLYAPPHHPRGTVHPTKADA